MVSGSEELQDKKMLLPIQKRIQMLTSQMVHYIFDKFSRFERHFKKERPDENRSSQVLYIGTEHLCSFGTFQNYKTHCYFNSCRKIYLQMHMRYLLVASRIKL